MVNFRQALKVVGVGLFLVGVTGHAEIPTDWRYTQELQVPQKGLVRIQLPLETLSNAQPRLGDLRVMDPSGQEIGYVIDQPLIQPARMFPLMGLSMVMSQKKTVITGQVPPEMQKTGFDELFLYSPTDDFLKPVTVETSSDRIHWSPMVQSYPIFKQPGQSLSTRFEFPKTQKPYLRITLDDSATPPIRVQSVSIYSAPQKLAGLQSIEAHLLEMSSDARQTEIQLLLPADNLTIDEIRIVTPDGTFRRPVTASVKTYSGGEFRESTVARGLVHRISLNQKTSENTALYVGRQIPGRQLTLRLDNGDSRPLTIAKVVVDLVPATLLFDAPEPGRYALWVGNLLAGPKTYDIAEVRGNLTRVPLSLARVGSLAANPGYHDPEPLPQVAEEGTEIDLEPWHYRKALTFGQSGIQRLEPDLQVVSHNAGRLAALRVVQHGKQLPYIVDQSGVNRDLAVQIVPAGSQGSVSRWTLTLPEKGLPLSVIQCAVPTSLFQRTMTLYELVSDERGEISRRVIGQGSWTRAHGEAKDGFSLTLYQSPQSDTLTLETDNRDNAPIEITSARAYYQTPRLLFKATPGKDTYLYYGNPDIAAPQYDLELVASEILATPPAEATLGAEEVLKAKPWWEIPVPEGSIRYGFWLVLGLVVLGLLVVIAKLLPPENEVPTK